MKTLTFEEIQEKTGVLEPTFRNYIQRGLLPPAISRVGKPGCKHAGSSGSYHPSTPAWIRDIQRVARDQDDFLKKDAHSEIRMLEWLKAVAEFRLGASLESVVGGIDRVIRNLQKRT